MEKRIRIIILIATFCSFIGGNLILQESESFRLTRNATPTNLDLFIDDISTLILLTDGIFRQSKLSQDFVKETSKYFHANSEKFSKFYQMNIDSVIKDIASFNSKIQKLNLKSDFERLIHPVQILSFLAMSSPDFNEATDSSSITDYKIALNELNRTLPNFKPPDCTFLIDIAECLGSPIDIPATKDCYKRMKNTNKSEVLDFFENTKKLKNDLDQVQKLIGAYHKIKNLELIVRGAFHFSTESKLFENLATSLASTSREFQALKAVLDGNNLRISKRLKAAIFGPEIKYEETTRESVSLFSNIFKSKWLKAIFKEKEINKLKTGFEPFLKYSDSLTKIEKIVERTRGHQSYATGIYNRIKDIESWKEPFTIGKPLINTVESCVKDLPNLNSSFDFNLFINISNHSKMLAMNSETFLGFLDSIISKEADTVRGFDTLQDKLTLWKNRNWHQIQYNFASLLGRNGSEDIEDMIHLLDTSIHPMWDMYQHYEFRSKIAEHPDPLLFNDVLNQIDIDGISSISKCFFDKNFPLGRMDEILEGADNVKKFKEEVNEKMMKDVENYLNGVSEILNLLKSAENYLKRNLSPESKFLNEFSNTEDVIHALAKGRMTMTIMSGVQKNESIIKEVINSNFKYQDRFWKNWEKKGRNQAIETIRQVKNLDKYIQTHRNKNLQEAGNVFKKAAEIPGLVDVFDSFESFRNNVTDITEGKEIADVFDHVESLDLDFSSYSDELHYASVNIGVLNGFLNDYFSKKKETQWKFKDIPVFQLILMVLGLLFLIFMALLIINSFTKNGRKRMRMFYLKWLASERTRELQWRYLFWVDQESEKNALCEAVREINFDQVKSLIDRGVYVNVYNQFGNTPLHAAAKYGHVKIVDYLIKNGADRNAYNFENKIPEQLLSESVQTTIRLSITEATTSVTEGTKKSHKTESERFSEIEKIFEKHRKNKYKQKMPVLLPTMAYRIRIDTRLTDASCEAFTEKFKGNVTDQMSGVTHFIVPTSENGIFESDDFGYIMCVFLPTIMMKKQWMSACLEKKSNFRNDYKYRVEKVKYKGIIYETVLKWADWIHKQRLPFLFGVHIHVAIEGMSKNELIQLRQLVEMHGATWWDDMLIKENYNIGSHPYHHFNLGPLFVIHDGKKNLQSLKNDKENMFTLMTFEKFVVFMLKLECRYDSKRNVPIPVITHLDESD